jgi:hypothetical protein
MINCRARNDFVVARDKRPKKPRKVLRGKRFGSAVLPLLPAKAKDG